MIDHSPIIHVGSVGLTIGPTLDPILLPHGRVVTNGGAGAGGNGDVGSRSLNLDSATGALR